jgi:acetaldehyde dehydrogenase
MTPVGAPIIDLTSAATGSWCVPAVNLDEHFDARHLNMATGDAQASVPIVATLVLKYPRPPQSFPGCR